MNHYKKHTKCRNTKKSTRTAKESYLRSKFKLAQGNPEETYFNTNNELRGKVKRDVNPMSIADCTDGSLKYKPNTINDYFAKAGRKVAENPAFDYGQFLIDNSEISNLVAFK